MSQDKTRVKFIMFNNELLALFPDNIESGYRMIECYAHNGQHSLASRSLMHCKAATKEQYRALQLELESPPYSYSLCIMNKA